MQLVYVLRVNDDPMCVCYSPAAQAQGLVRQDALVFSPSAPENTPSESYADLEKVYLKYFSYIAPSVPLCLSVLVPSPFCPCAYVSSLCTAPGPAGSGLAPSVRVPGSA